MPYLKTDPQNHAPLEEQPNFLGKFLTFGVLGVVVVIGGFMLWRSLAYSTANGADFRAPNSVDPAKIIAKIQEHIVVPIDEVPLVGTITNAQALRTSQPFFDAAQDGDIIVVYQKHERAILYRPSRDILVNTGPIIFPSSSVAGNSQPALAEKTVSSPTTALLPNIPLSEPLKLDIRNGSHTSGVAAQLGKVFSSEKSYNVVSVTPASRTTYSGTTIIVLTSAAENQLETLKKKLGSVTVINQLPPGEKNSTADSVIILGN